MVSKHRTRLHAGPAQTVGLGVGGPPPSWTQPVPRAPHCPLPAWPPQPLPAPRPRMLASRLELRGQRMRTSPTSPVRFAGGWGVLRRRRRVLNAPETFYCRWCPTARHAGERPPYPEFPRDTPTFPAPAPPRRARDVRVLRWWWGEMRRKRGPATENRDRQQRLSTEGNITRP